MRIKQMIFVFVIISFAVLCVFKMNLTYDSLSRYPYEDVEARELIKKHLNKKDIEYIIEYSIEPSYFLRFIEAKGFNIYHTEYYDELEEVCWFLTPDELVTFAETVFSTYSVDELSVLLEHYKYNEIMYWVEYKDQYNLDTSLVLNANDLLAYVDDENSVSIREPYDLIVLDGFEQVDDSIEIYVSDRIMEPLKLMYSAMAKDLGIKKCGGLLIDSGYVTYQRQKDIYYNFKNEFGNSGILMTDYPGHSENQLGTSIDFAVLNVNNDDFDQTIQYNWLSRNAYLYGFYQTYQEDFVNVTQKANRPNHFRFVGYENAIKMYENNESLKEYLNR